MEKVRLAKIRDDKWIRFGPALMSMGLCGQMFRSIDEEQDQDQVVVHPDDVTNGRPRLPIRSDIVEFVES